MPLLTNTGSYLTGREAARSLGIAHRTFLNKRSERGDHFLRGHALLPGRVFFRVEDVERVASERDQ